MKYIKLLFSDAERVSKTPIQYVKDGVEFGLVPNDDITRSYIENLLWVREIDAATILRNFHNKTSLEIITPKIKELAAIILSIEWLRKKQLVIPLSFRTDKVQEATEVIHDDFCLVEDKTENVEIIIREYTALRDKCEASINDLTEQELNAGYGSDMISGINDIDKEITQMQS